MSTVANDVRGVAAPRFGAGLAFAAVSATAFGLSGTLARGLLDTGWSPAAAVVVRVLVGAAVLLVPALLVLRGRWHLLRRNLSLVTAFGVVAVAGAQFAYFNAVEHLQVGVALLIEFTAPVAVVLWMWLRHGQAPTRLTVLGAAVAAVGLVLVLNVGAATQLSTVGVLWALTAMAGAATYFVLSADERNGVPPLVLAAGGLVVGGVVLLAAGAVGLIRLDVSAAPAVYSGVEVPWWLPVAALAVVTAALSYTTGIAASRRLGSRLASFVALSEVVMALVFAWLLLGELPLPVQLLGGLLILAGVAVVKMGERYAASRAASTAGSADGAGVEAGDADPNAMASSSRQSNSVSMSSR
jgi:drug/metabolite transporter (DMT)-like permease